MNLREHLACLLAAAGLVLAGNAAQAAPMKLNLGLGRGESWFLSDILEHAAENQPSPLHPGAARSYREIGVLE